MKIPKNSLFAILLRSRWWISFAIAAAVALVTGLLFPREIAPFAMLATLPFLVVGSIAAWRQMQQPNPAKSEQLLADCAKMNWSQFSEQLQRAWQAEGYEVQRLNHGDGAELLLKRQGRSTVVSAKRWKAANQGLEPLRELQKQKDQLQAQGAVYVLLQPLHENAVAWAKQQEIVVLSGPELAQLLHKAA